MAGLVIAGRSRILFCRLDYSVRIRVAEKEALESYRLCIAGVSLEHNSAASFTDNANATPDRRLHNEICDIALCAHESLQPAAWYAKKAALPNCPRVYERSLGVQKVQLAREVEPLVVGDDFGLPHLQQEEKIDLPVKHDKQIDSLLTMNEQWDVFREGLLLTVRPQALDHILCEFWKREIGTGIRDVPRTGFTFSFIGHGGGVSSLNAELWSRIAAATRTSTIP